MQAHFAACVAGSPQTALAANHKAYYYPFLKIWKNVPSGRDLRGHLCKALILKMSRPRLRGLWPHKGQAATGRKARLFHAAKNAKAVWWASSHFWALHLWQTQLVTHCTVFAKCPANLQPSAQCSSSPYMWLPACALKLVLQRVHFIQPYLFLNQR